MPLSPAPSLTFTPEALHQAIAQRYHQALERGSLQPIATEEEAIAHGDLNFLVRIINNLQRKEQERLTIPPHQNQDFNPFLPPDPSLYLGELGPHHGCVLNKYNVFSEHLLVITKTFQPQEQLLTLGDFRALLRLMAPLGGLAFFNGGKRAGASVKHKHLQLITGQSLGTEGLPLQRAIAGHLSPESDRIHTIPDYGFRHGYLGHNPEALGDPTMIFRHYQQLITHFDLGDFAAAAPHQRAPYNLLMTPQWLLIVPRSQEKSQGISINALGFTGNLLAKDRAGLHTIKQRGPLGLLRDVAMPTP